MATAPFRRSPAKTSAPARRAGQPVDVRGARIARALAADVWPWARRPSRPSGTSRGGRRRRPLRPNPCSMVGTHRYTGGDAHVRIPVQELWRAPRGRAVLQGRRADHLPQRAAASCARSSAPSASPSRAAASTRPTAGRRTRNRRRAASPTGRRASRPRASRPRASSKSDKSRSPRVVEG